MKKLTLYIYLFFSGILLAQIGVGIEPTTTLDINGELRVRKIDESTNSDAVTLVIDDNGELKRKQTES